MKGATPGHKSMKGYHSVWKETHGVWQTNKMLPSSEEEEYEVFVGADAADGLREDWKRPMRWAGFLAMEAGVDDKVKHVCQVCFLRRDFEGLVLRSLLSLACARALWAGWYVCECLERLCPRDPGGSSMCTCRLAAVVERDAL